MRILKNVTLVVLFLMVLFLVVSGLSSNAIAYKAISDNRNRVRVDVKPVQLTPGKSVKFEVRMNTHSVGLKQDLLTVCTLTDDQGNEYQPTNWDGSSPGGHHRSGVLEFPALEGDPGSVTLVIRNIANVPARKFEWTVDR
jgi:hypothetical protein